MTHDPERGFYERCSGCGFEIGGDEFPVESQAGDFCRQCAGQKINELAEAARWRKWPEEKPEQPMVVWLITDGGATGSGYFDGKEIHDGNDGWNGYATRWTHWRPIGELPKQEGGGDE